MNSNQPILPRISLSIYSFGYSAGFINDVRPDSSKYQTLSPIGVAHLARELGLGGIEIPIDKYFPNPANAELADFINEVQSLNLKVYFDLEEFNPTYFNQVAGLVAKHSTFIRAKVSNFYGGNRFRNKELYANDLEKFTRQIDDCLKTIKGNNLQLLIENHQDIVLEDIQVLINRFGEDVIGVNWDIGNSLPSGETTESFISKVGKHIKNVHLKDYLLFDCKEGYIMSRCPLGEGFVDFKFCLSNLDKDIPLTIELGALNGRMAEIYNHEYWTHTNGISDDEKEEFLSFIKANVQPGDHRSAWERKLSPEEINKSEMTELFSSVHFLKTILSDNEQ